MRNFATARRPASFVALTWMLWPAFSTTTRRPRGASVASRAGPLEWRREVVAAGEEKRRDRRELAAVRRLRGRLGRGPREALADNAFQSPWRGRTGRVARAHAIRGVGERAGRRPGVEAELPHGKRQSVQSALACRPWLSCDCRRVAPARGSSPGSCRAPTLRRGLPCAAASVRRTAARTSGRRGSGGSADRAAPPLCRARITAARSAAHAARPQTSPRTRLTVCICVVPRASTPAWGTTESRISRVHLPRVGEGVALGDGSFP